jgi:hypothetical protein
MVDWKPRIDSKTSLAVALSAVGVTLATYAHYMPSLTDHRVGAPDDPDAAAAERAAFWTSSAIIGSLFLVTMDPLVFIMGLGTVAGVSFLHKHANSTNPATSRAAVASTMAPVASTSDQTTGTAYDSAYESGAY